MFDKVKSKIFEFSKNKHFKVGIPILVFIIVGSLQLREFSSIRYRFKTVRPVDHEALKLLMKPGGLVTLESEYEKIKDMDREPIVINSPIRRGVYFLGQDKSRVLSAMELTCSIQNYDWGVKGLKSLVAKIARSNMDIDIDENKSYAEFWMGTHPNGPSILKESKLSLSEYIQKNPLELGQETINCFGIQLPFLFKILSVDKALSIQIHPTKCQAEFLHKKMPHIYKDSNHKPEMAVALTKFEVLCSFRPVKEIKFFLKNICEFGMLIEKKKLDAFLNCDKEMHEAMKECFQSLMECSSDNIRSATDSLISRLENYDKSGANLYHYDLVIKLNKEFPYDVGIFCIYWLNYIVLEPGEAIYLAANEPHAYLSGDCIECMANSDNVIRAGLTPKFRDVGTLCDMLSYNNFTPSEFVLSPIREKEGTTLFSPPINDFSLARVTVPANKEYTLIERASSSILLVVSGRATTDSGKYLREGSVFYLPSNRKFSVKTEEDLTIFQAFCNV